MKYGGLFYQIMKNVTVICLLQTTFTNIVAFEEIKKVLIFHVYRLLTDNTHEMPITLLPYFKI